MDRQSWGEPLYPDTVTALMTKLINAHNKSVVASSQLLPHARLHDVRHLHAPTLLFARWASWQTFRDGEEPIASQQAEIKQEATLLQVATITRGLSEAEGGYHWSGELRLWDNEVLMGWYAANDGSIRSKGTMYFVLHPQGLNMSGRWVGLGFDGRIMIGWVSMGQTQERVREDHGQPYQQRGSGLRQ